MRSRRLILISALALPSLWILSAGLASSEAPPAAGESWEVTSQMSMAGMPMEMPAQTRRVCAKPDTAPENPDPNCSNTAMSRVGNKLTWQVQCTGASAMSGRGEIVYTSADAYKGTIRFESADGVMTLKLTGKRLGSCQAR